MALGDEYRLFIDPIPNSGERREAGKPAAMLDPRDPRNLGRNRAIWTGQALTPTLFS